MQLINKLDNSKYRRLLSRVAEKLHLKNEKAFSDEEILKLQSAFELSAVDVNLLLETIEFILLQVFVCSKAFNIELFVCNGGFFFRLLITA